MQKLIQVIDKQKILLLFQQVVQWLLNSVIKLRRALTEPSSLNRGVHTVNKPPRRSSEVSELRNPKAAFYADSQIMTYVPRAIAPRRNVTGCAKSKNSLDVE